MEVRQLPVGWEATCLADVSEKIVDGSHNPPKSTEEGLPMLSARNIADRRIEFDVEHRLISSYDFEVEHRRTEVAGGDVLLTIVGAIGRTAVVPETCPPFTLQRSVSVIKPSACIGSDFLSYMLESPEIQAFLLDNAKGTAQKGIYLKQLQRLPIQIAPLNEQRRIAAKLDTTLAAVESCRQRLEGVATLIKRFRQAVLEAAITGSLSEEWRDANGLQWAPKRLTIGEVGSIVTGNTPPQISADADGKFPLFKPTELDAGYEVISAKEMMGEKRANGSRMLPPLSVLVTCIGATIGKTGLSRVEGATNQQINALVCNRSIALPQWAYFWFSSPIGQAAVVNNASATTMPIINKSRFSALEIELPDVDEQEVIVQQVEALFSLADQLEAKLTAARQVVERLTPALLAKAFRGELVPQDPADEPASVLLERIRAARQADAAARTPSRRGRRKAAANPAPSLFDAAPAPPDQLATLLRECGALSEKALLAASELDPSRFAAQLALEQQAGRIRPCWEDGEEMWEAAG